MTIKLTDLDGLHLTPECVIAVESDSGDAQNSICEGRQGCSIRCPLRHDDMEIQTSCLLSNYAFWVFVVLFSIGGIAFNVTNSLSDAICFDVLGKNFIKVKLTGYLLNLIFRCICSFVIDVFPMYL